MKRKFTDVLYKAFLVGLFAAICAGSTLAGAAAPKVKHAVIGSVETVDKTSRTVAVKTADGTVETFKWTDKTAVVGADDSAKAADFTGREGSHVVIHYSVKGSEKTAEAVEFVGKDAPQVVEGTIKSAGSDGRMVIVKTADGTEKTFEVSKDAVVDSSDGLADAGKYTAGKTAEGAKVTVHYTDEGGRSVARFIKRL